MSETAREFKVDRKRIRDWRDDEQTLRATSSEGGVKKKRLPGGGPKIRSKELENQLRIWICEQREKRLPVSRRMIKKKALEVSTSENAAFAASDGWLQKFLKREGYTLRRRTTTAQSSADSTQKIAKFVLYLSKTRKNFSYSESDIFVMDETPIWIEPTATTTVEKVGSKSVPVKSTGHEKTRVTAIFTAKADGTKLKPYVVIPRKRIVKDVESIKEVVVSYAAKSWMDDKLTIDYLKRIIGSFSFRRRLIIWDSFTCHKSSSTKKTLSKMKIDSAIIPGGCTSHIQAPDVSWNKSIKAALKRYHEEWLVNEEHDYTLGGNIKPPSFALICSWIAMAWKSLPHDQILRSMKQCAITTALDGSEDNMIEHFRNNEFGLQSLKQLRQNDSDHQLEELSDDNDNPEDVIDCDSSLCDTDDISWCDSDESN